MDPLCGCGHSKRDHIYEEGACRPGFICGEGCTEYAPEGYRGRMDKVHVYVDKEAKFRWRRVSENGEIVSESGQGYITKAHVLSMAKDLNDDAELIEDIVDIV